MEQLQKQLAEMGKRVAALSRAWKLGLGAGLAAIVLAVGLGSVASSTGEFQYAYTNLSTEDSAEIAAQLKSAGIPHRFEAGGSAVAVASARVYDARLLLAAAGLPRSNGAGFELFDKGDFGVSDFTQKVNLRRATEGELARTIGRIAGVRSARVHLVLAEKGIFRGEERAASAAVMVNLQPGRTLTERELAGVRHLVASGVPSLSPQAVTIVDGRGSVLSTDATWGDGLPGFKSQLERDLEQRVVSLLEPVVGAGQVVARVTADVNAAEVTSTQDQIDPEGSVLRSERTVVSSQQSDSERASALAGAAGNQPGPGVGNTAKSATNSQEETRNFDVSRTTTRTVQRTPRLTRLSVAVLVDGLDGKPRDDAEVQRLGELVRKAVGFDPARGDQLEISSAAFTHHGSDEAAPPLQASLVPEQYQPYVGLGAAVLVLAVIGLGLMRRRGRRVEELKALRPGARVAELEAERRTPPTAIAPLDPPVEAPAPAPAAVALPTPATPAALPDPALAVRERARELVKADPVRAANLLRSWLSSEARENANA